ncbi:HlyD family type I secretion periplasmic adaptor subunit [Amphritea sp. 1_MG-2023]|uniref:HlyD family type I secretion periplasmic adaptor subunit n=1 Tax=Amphritea sp. 1_MG-2023 TaxID=3062670 RepID=UPI0026E19A6C|nr:HlyD family type I secretion periplasmic adaptor subunit [Amphritea sp. 1_MG-2023]MDO6564942.1 HlyD family type I secretion periplasmic adaptor subunit [Amphritea sp. 1_MG-2023]
MGDFKREETSLSAAEVKVEGNPAAVTQSKSSEQTVDGQLHGFIDNAAASVLLDTPRSSRLLLWAVVCFVLIAIIWAYFAELDEITRGEGSVIPSQQIQVVQYLEGGILKELYVREGDKVEAGQPLLRVDETRFLSDFRGQAQEQAYLEVSIARHRAELASIIINDEIAQADWREQVQIKAQPIALGTEWQVRNPELLEREESQLEEYLRNLNNQLDIIGRQIEQGDQEAKELESKISHLYRSYRLGLRELNMTKPLADEGVIPEIELIKLERDINRYKQDLEGARLLLPKVQLSIAESVAKRREIALNARSESQQKLNQSLAELKQKTEAQVNLRDRVDRTTVVSPVHGTIKTISVNTIGGVIQPGMDLIEIVPTEDHLLIEAKISPKDIAFLRPGLEAVVRLTAYDFSIYGGLKGTLEHISADTIEDEKGNLYYLIRVRTENTDLGRGVTSLPIIPGMMATVDIMTGKKSVLDYLLKPIFKAQQQALRER